VRVLLILGVVAIVLSLLLAGCGDAASPGASDGVGGGKADSPASMPERPMPMQASPASPDDPCAAASLGDGSYCGGSIGGDPGALYTCAGAATSTRTPCDKGCQVNPPGLPDACIDDNAYHLPWTCGVSYPTTQGNHGDVCGSNGGDHTGTQDFAWDFGIPRHTPILASRGGTVTVAANVTAPGQGCYDGCTQPFGTTAFSDCCNSCINVSNHVNVLHSDGTVATYWHLDSATVKTGDHVNAGDPLGYSGTSGCSSGPHLHFQVMGNCPTGYCQSIAIQFQEAGVPACGDTVKSTNGC
jgi:hypothetical protein